MRGMNTFVSKQIFRKWTHSRPLNADKQPHDNREEEAKFLRCWLYYEGAFSIMEPAEFSRISFWSKIDFGARIWAVDKNLDQLLVIILRKSGLKIWI